MFFKEDEDGREMVTKGITSVARGLNRAKFIQVGRFSSSENFVCEKEELVIYAFINF